MPVITKPNQHFDATLYTGNGGTQSITNAGSMQPDFVWIKSRSTIKSHCITDVVRGTNLQLASNSTGADQSTTDGITAFNSNGFSLGAGVQQYSSNDNGTTYVAWQWKAGGTAVTNTSGSISSQVSANQTAGFSIVTYTGDRTSSGSSTVGHGLGVAPSLIITKRRNGASDWVVQTPFVGQDYFLLLNTTAAIQTSASTGAGTLPLPTSTTFGVTYYTGMNVNGQTCVAYCFAQVAGYSAFGSYTGNGSSNGPFIYTGFRPRYIMRKRTDTTAYWIVYDTARNTYNLVGEDLYPNDSLAGSNDSTMDILSNGFKIRGTGANLNANGGTYIYAAFAEAPFKYANAR